MKVTPNEAWFIFMAVATLTILVVGTLGAADLLHRPHRRGADEVSTTAPREEPAEHSRDAAAVGRDAQPEAVPGRGTAAAEVDTIQNREDPRHPGRAA